MRLFLAIDLPPQILFRLDRLLAALRPEALINWSPLDNLHITTKFIGEWPEARINELHAVLIALAPRHSFGIELCDLGWFLNKRSPRVLWAGVNGGEALKSLAHDIEDHLAELGIKREEREVSPHLTLARIKHPVPLGRLRQKVDEMQKVEFGKFPVSQITLFRSDPGSNSSIYRWLYEYKFEAALAASGSEQ